VRAIYVSHEFQHGNQFNNDTRTYMLACIFKYFYEKGELDLDLEEEHLPLEYDAIRNSKKVVVSIQSNKLFGWFLVS
ncbi:hypothetical protein ACFLQZ_02935, partial [Acidobacteriota bacterium]